MVKSIVVSDEITLGKAVFGVLKVLQNRTFDVVNIHSAHRDVFNVLEEASLAGTFHIVDTMVVIPLKPRRKLCLDTKEKPVVTFVSDRQICIVRIVSKRDILTKVILVNRKIPEGDDTDAV